jgi:hypothetical protein
LGDLVVGSPDLEDAYGLEAFELQVDFSTKPLREGGRLDERGFCCYSFDTPTGSDNIVKSWQSALVHEWVKFGLLS